jgi:two-component system, OmpR family, copper resistance phosphate regulon response regulator CusR
VLGDRCNLLQGIYENFLTNSSEAPDSTYYEWSAYISHVSFYTRLFPVFLTPLFMCRILIAEDESRISAFIAKGLQKNGFLPTVAEDGEQALEFAETGEFALLLLDIGLPLKDGWSVMQELRQQNAAVPIIVVTALNEDTRTRAMASGANDFVAKPFRFSDLLAKVRSLLNNPEGAED